MRIFIKLLLGTAILGAIAVQAPASATVITFDDLPLSPQSSPVPNGYNGLNWSNFNYGTPSGVPPLLNSGYTAGTVSPFNIAFNPFGSVASFSASAPFKLDGFYLTAAWYDGLSVQVDGYRNGSLQWSQALSPSATGATLYNFGRGLVDQVTISSSGGTPHPGYLGSGAHFVLDNMTINGAGGVPEPATWALMILGFGGIGTALRSRRQKVIISYS